jgi:hypothetical protein
VERSLLLLECRRGDLSKNDIDKVERTFGVKKMGTGGSNGVRYGLVQENSSEPLILNCHVLFGNAPIRVVQ